MEWRRNERRECMVQKEGGKEYGEQQRVRDGCRDIGCPALSFQSSTDPLYSSGK